MANYERIEGLKKLDSIQATAKYFGIGEHRLRHLCKTDPDLPCIKIGQIRKIIVDKFPEYLEKCSRENRTL
jgi:hypothetical protein